jgi:hypothetical protein
MLVQAYLDKQGSIGEAFRKTHTNTEAAKRKNSS